MSQQRHGEAELTEEMVAAAMAKADRRFYVGSDRCYAFPDRLEDARASCTPQGRCTVGAPGGSSPAGVGARA